MREELGERVSGHAQGSVPVESREERARDREAHAHAMPELPSFYGMLQMGVGELKRLRGQVHASAPRRRRVTLALIVRAASIVAFAVAYVTAFTSLLGAQASTIAVASFVMLLCLRFVGYNYTFGGNIAALATACGTLLVAPIAGMHLGALGRLAVNLVALTVLMTVCVDDPRMGNGGTYGFAYCFAVGSVYDVPLTSGEIPARAAAVALAFAVCAGVLWRHRRETSTGRRLRDALGSFGIRSEAGAYRLRAAIGISLAIFAAQALGLPRSMWAGFVASSLLTPYGLGVRDRAPLRAAATLAGCVAFALVYPRVPASVLPLWGIFVGLGTGICSKYHWSQFFNTLGGLGSACLLFGVAPSVGWRVAETVLAVTVCVLFAAAARLLRSAVYNLETS